MRGDQLHELPRKQMKGHVALRVGIEYNQVVGLASLRQIEPAVFVEDVEAGVGIDCEVLSRSLDSVGVNLCYVPFPPGMGGKEGLGAREATATDEQDVFQVGVDCKTEVEEGRVGIDEASGVVDVHRALWKTVEVERPLRVEVDDIEEAVGGLLLVDDGTRAGNHLRQGRGCGGGEQQDEERGDDHGEPRQPDNRDQHQNHAKPEDDATNVPERYQTKTVPKGPKMLPTGEIEEGVPLRFPSEASCCAPIPNAEGQGNPSRKVGSPRIRVVANTGPEP